MRTLCNVHDEDNLHRLRVTLPTPGFVLDDSADFIARDKELLQKFFTFNCELASIRCWSQMQFNVQIPQMLAMVHHESHDRRWQCMDHAHQTWEAVLAAERLVYQECDRAALRKGGLRDCLKDLAWNQLQLSRESYSICKAASWDPTNEELRLFSFLLHGRPANTKFFLEDVFAHLADVARRHSKNETMQRCPFMNDVAL